MGRRKTNRKRHRAGSNRERVLEAGDTGAEDPNAGELLHESLDEMSQHSESYFCRARPSESVSVRAHREGVFEGGD